MISKTDSRRLKWMTPKEVKYCICPMSCNACSLVCSTFLVHSWFLSFMDQSKFSFCSSFEISFYIKKTVLLDWESKKPHLCSKFALFKTYWRMLRVLAQLSPFWLVFTISESFQIRYCITLYLREHQKYDRSNSKHLN